jgi:Flp pilus assembly pilin Flp
MESTTTSADTFVARRGGLRKGDVVSLVSYIELVVTPFVRARLGLTDDRGASLVEYALLVALIAVVCILAITFLGRETSDKLSNLGSAIE